MNPFAALDATAQADLQHRGDVSPVELVAAAIAAAEQVNPVLNAIIHPRYERALEEAAAIDPSLPFAGVPLVVKDLDGTLADEPYHAGTRHLRDAGYRATVTSTLFSRLQAAGFVIIGKTNTPEFGLVPSTEPLSYGPTPNPYGPDHSAGGSSGGSAAAVAAGVVPVGHAGDGGGSIRIPASECGLVGLKPSRGRVPMGPVENEGWGGLVARLVVTRSVRDTAAVLDLAALPAWGEAYGVTTPLRSYLDELTDPAKSLRIGVTTVAPGGIDTDPQCAAAAQRTGELLASLGHRVESAAPALLADEDFYAEMSRHFLSAYPVWVAEAVEELVTMTGIDVTPDSVEPLTWELAESGRIIRAVTFLEALDGLRRAGRAIQQWWADGFDVLITPTLPELPPRLGEFGATDDNPLNGMFRSTSVVSNTLPFNVSGQPAISVPVAMSEDGLPIGVQLVGAMGRDDHLIGLAAQLEASVDWAVRRPGVWAG